MNVVPTSIVRPALLSSGASHGIIGVGVGVVAVGVGAVDWTERFYKQCAECKLRKLACCRRENARARTSIGDSSSQHQAEAYDRYP